MSVLVAGWREAEGGGDDEELLASFSGMSWCRTDDVGAEIFTMWACALRRAPLLQ
jgi:hypothetical protein